MTPFMWAWGGFLVGFGTACVLAGNRHQELEAELAACAANGVKLRRYYHRSRQREDFWRIAAEKNRAYMERAEREAERLTGVCLAAGISPVPDDASYLLDETEGGS